MKFNINEIKNKFSNFYKDIEFGIECSQNESEEKLKAEIERRILNYLKTFNLDLSTIVQYETSEIGFTKISGRIDALYGNVIIEYKKYALLDNEKELNKALKQLKDKYLNKVTSRLKSKYIGILFDGKNIAFYKYNLKKDDWELEVTKFSKDSLYSWITYITGSMKKEVSPTLLKNDFSLNKTIPLNFIMTLYKNLLASKSERVNMLYNEWDKTFRYVYGGVLDDLSFDEILKDIVKANKDIKINDFQIDKFLFVIYTYYAFIVKLFASEIACVNLKITPETPIRHIKDSSNLKEALYYIEDGHFFRDISNIDNYIEGGFFSWYLECLNDETIESISSILSIINEYEPLSFFADEHQSRDLLKGLYEDIVPQKIRHDLGEYYTPDWLAQIAVEDSGFSGNESSKALDPACGSGAFIVEFINTIKKELSTKDLTDNQIIEYICTRVVGFDVNPVAILTARTNYLIAISPYINKSSETITLPIYLADSIITPTTEGRSKVENNSYKISTVEGEFSIPKSLLDKGLLGKILRLVEETIFHYYPLEDFNKRLEKESIFLDKFEQKEIDFFYIKILELHKLNRNQIWAKIILNSFAPLLHNNFTHVIGNPPWIKWDFLSKEYRNKLSILYLDIYKLFSHKGMKASLGHAHDDISILFTYIAMDKYLAKNGKLTFVLKQTLYKSIAGEQFRRFAIEKIKETIPVTCVRVHDMLKLNPFGQGQETSVVTLEKNSNTTYPIKYNIWNKEIKSRFKQIDTAEYVRNNCEIIEMDAYPDPTTKSVTAPWITIPMGQSLPKMSSIGNFYKARHGVVNDLNSLFLIEIVDEINEDTIKIRNLGDKGKKKIKTLTKSIEKDIVYPLIKPKDAKKWGVTSYQYMIIPQMKAGENNESDLRINYPKGYSFLSSFRDELATRKSKWFYGGDKPFYSLFGIGEYTFQKFKIVWCCMSYQPHFSVVSTTNDSLIGEKTFIPDNTIGYISVDDENEAHYICSLLNSNKTQALFALKSSKSKWGISIEMVNQVPISEYNNKDAKHKELASLSIKAHNSLDIKEIKRIENNINDIVDNNSIFSV